MSGSDTSSVWDQSINDPPTKHWAFNDPKADVLLVSSDEVIFRVHSWHLRQKSQFIDDLLNISTTGDLTESPIHLDALSSVVEIYINMVYSTDTLRVSISFTHWSQLFDLCGHMQSSEIEERARKDLYAHAPLDPWRVFTIASQRKDEGLAKEAINFMGMCDQGKGLPYSLSGKEIELVDPGYLAGLLQARFFPRGKSSAVVSDANDAFIGIYPWAAVARRFRVSES